MNNNNSFGRELGSSLRHRGFRADELSLEEWNYLRGLFLADGCARLKRYQRREGVVCVVEFFLGENEGELGRHVVGLLRRVGLNPWMGKRSPREHMLIVSTYSRSLFEFLPDKKVVQGSATVRERFFEENKLLSVEFGVPFVAGLFDGDGYCGCLLRKGRVFFGEVERCMWAFTQRKYLFLIDYVVKFVESLSPGSVRLRGYDHGTIDVNLRRPAMDALLNAGISKYSWKAAQWLRKVAEAQSERSKYYTTGQVALMLGVSRQTAYRSVRAGKIECVRGEVPRRQGSSYHYIPVEEVERLKRELGKRR